MLFDLKKGAQRLQKNWWRRFFGSHTKKGLHDLCGTKFVGKSHIKHFRARLGKFRQKSFAPPKICLLLHLWSIKLSCFSVRRVGRQRLQLARSAALLLAERPSPCSHHQRWRQIRVRIPGQLAKVSFELVFKHRIRPTQQLFAACELLCIIFIFFLSSLFCFCLFIHAPSEPNKISTWSHALNYLCPAIYFIASRCQVAF